MHRLALALALLFALAACEGGDGLPSSDVAATDVTARLAADYEDGLGSLETFRVFALGTSLYYVAVGDSTERTFQLVRDPEAGMPNDINAGNLFAFFPPSQKYLAAQLDSATVSGPVEREGVMSLVLESSDPADAGFGAAPGTVDHLARVYIDAETYDVRELFHRFRVDTIATPLAQRILYEDYRDVGEGVRLPFRVRQIQEGLQPTEEQKMVRGATFAVREQQAQMLPPARRDSALRELEREKRFFAEGINEVILNVDSVLVNVPPPDTLSAPGVL